MKAGDLASLFQLAVAVNLGFGALVSFIDPIREEANASSIEDYIADRVLKQSGKSTRYKNILNELCQNHFRFHSLLAHLQSRLRFFNGLMARVAFAVVAAISLVGLVLVSAKTDKSISQCLIWIPVILNSVPMLFAFLLCYQLPTYYHEIRPLMKQCLNSIRKLETIN